MKEIWIRSANGNELLLCCGFEVVGNHFYAYTAYTARDFGHAGDFIAQDYATHERAIEVLDEISDNIDSDCVFQLPKE